MSKIYFPLTVEDAIIRYNTSTGSLEREYIYQSEIHKPLNKLVENVMHTFKFYNYDSTYADLKHETIVYLHERLYNYNPTNGKAFSYFTIVTRNYLIARSKETTFLTTSKDELEEVDNRRNIINEVVLDERRGLLSEFIKEWSNWGIENINKLFLRDRDRRIGEAVFVLFQDCTDVENFNKKSLYILIREHAGVKTQYITRIVNRLRVMYGTMFPEYNKRGTIDWDHYLNLYVEIDQTEFGIVTDEKLQPSE